MESKYQSSAFWDEWYRNQDCPVEWSAPASPALVARIRAVLDSLPKPPDGQPLRLCEVGCGTSSLAVALAGEGTEVCGVDFSDEVIAQMQRRHPEISWRQCDALMLSQALPLGSLNCVIAKTFLDCLLTRNDAEVAVRRFLEEARAVLRDDGRLVLLDRHEAAWLIRRGEVETIANEETTARPMILRILTPLAPELKEESSEVPEAQRLRITFRWPRCKDVGLETRRIAGAGALLVIRAEGHAADAGLRIGDRILATDGNLGDASSLRRKLDASAKGKAVLLIERFPTVSSKRVAAASRSVSSQNNHLLRLHVARELERSNSSRPSRKPSRKPAVPDAISAPRDAAAGLFALGAPAPRLLPMLSPATP